MPTVPDAHMCSVRADSADGLMPSASAASDEMWLWNAVRSGMTEPTTRPSTSFGLTPGTESKHALRSEEHTSELQSQSNLVCRLLLEKKKEPFFVCQYP